MKEQQKPPANSHTFLQWLKGRLAEQEALDNPRTAVRVLTMDDIGGYSLVNSNYGVTIRSSGHF